MPPEEFEPTIWHHIPSVDEWVAKMLAARQARLEQQAEAFLRMGYTTAELTVVQYPDGYAEVSPKSCFVEER